MEGKNYDVSSHSRTLGPGVSAFCGGAARRPLALAPRRHRTGDWMHPATHPPRIGCRERLTRTRQQRRDKTNMSAKALAVCSFEPAVEQTVATDHEAPESLAAEIQFRGDLWREYRLEAIKAGSSNAQATAYASVLSSGMGLAASVSELTPVGRSWFYQSRPRVVWRTISPRQILLTRRERNKTSGRTAAAGASSSLSDLTN